MSVGVLIRTWRVYRGMTQEQLAARAGVSKATVCNVETDATDPKVGTLSAIAEALDCTVGIVLEPNDAEAVEP